jgi:predicted ATPase
MALHKEAHLLHPLKQVALDSILSFGTDATEIELGPLNVFIGPNASGKSNFLAAIDLLSGLTGDLLDKLRRSGGAAEWRWKGSGAGRFPSIDTIVSGPDADTRLRYTLRFNGAGELPIGLETLTDIDSGKMHLERSYDSFRVSGEGMELDDTQTVFSQLKDPVRHREITHVGRLFSQFRMFREWNFGRHSAVRQPQDPALHADFLLEDASNLAVVLNDLIYRGLEGDLIRQMAKVFDGPQAIRVKVYGGVVQFSIQERGLESPTPAARLSDGTTRFLCLLTILLHPQPPPVVCIEEPELGFHPDVMPVLAEMLIDASTRTQLIVTTHSPELIDALSDTPESVIVCERTEQGTRMERLDPRPLKEWIDEYRLGGAWKTGVIGGRR